jgi:hypothetical protein
MQQKLEPAAEVVNERRGRAPAVAALTDTSPSEAIAAVARKQATQANTRMQCT